MRCTDASFFLQLLLPFLILLTFPLELRILGETLIVSASVSLSCKLRWIVAYVSVHHLKLIPWPGTKVVQISLAYNYWMGLPDGFTDLGPIENEKILFLSTSQCLLPKTGSRLANVRNNNIIVLMVWNMCKQYLKSPMPTYEIGFLLDQKLLAVYHLQSLQFFLCSRFW